MSYKKQLVGKKLDWGPMRPFLGQNGLVILLLWGVQSSILDQQTQNLRKRVPPPGFLTF